MKRLENTASSVAGARKVPLLWQCDFKAYYSGIITRITDDYGTFLDITYDTMEAEISPLMAMILPIPSTILPPALMETNNSSGVQRVKNAALSGLKALVISPLTACVGAGIGGVDYSSGTLYGGIANGCGGLMPTLTMGFGEGMKAFFGWVDDAIIYLWE